MKQMAAIFFNSILSLLILFISVSCTRKNEDVTKIQFSLPSKEQLLKISEKHSSTTLAPQSKNSKSQKVKKQCASCDVAHVVFNVSGPGISPNIVCSLDSKRSQAMGPCAITEDSVSIEVSTGENRLFQVALVLQDTATNEMTFYYGDHPPISLTAGTSPTISIPVDVMGTANGLEGEVHGRYLTSPNQGPTGIIEMSLQPPDNKPAMTVMKQEIYNGYFKVFALGGVSFLYSANGQTLFGGAKTLEDFISMDQDSTDKVAVDSHVHNGTTKYSVLGFYGPGVATEYACEESNCTGTEFVDYFQLTPTNSSRFVTPFKVAANASNLLTLTGTTLTWDYLPNVSSALDGVHVYYIPSITPNLLQPYYLDENQIDCASLLQLPGAIDKGFIPISTTSINLGFAPPSDSMTFICPQRAGQVLTSAITYPKSNSSGDPNQKYLRMELMTAGQYNTDGYKVTKGECYSVQFKLFQGQGTNTTYLDPSGSSLPLNIDTSNLGAGQILTTCGGSTVNSVSLPDGQQNSPSYYFVANSTGVFNPTVSLSDNNIIFDGTHNQIQADLPVIKVTSPAQVLQSTCVGITISKEKFEGGPLMNGSTSVTLSDMANFYLRSSSDCSTGSTAMISSGPLTVYFKLMSAVNVDLTSYISATGYQTVVTNIIQPGN